MILTVFSQADHREFVFLVMTIGSAYDVHNPVKSHVHPALGGYLKKRSSGMCACTLRGSRIRCVTCGKLLRKKPLN